jgi:hypothetical protein
MSASDAISTAANVATAGGIIGVGWQLLLNRRQMTAGFERTFVDRYERVIHDVPLALLLGETFAPQDDELALRAFFEYFELCEEQLYYRETGKISGPTWHDWWEGIALNLRRPAFKQAWNHLKDRVIVSPGVALQARLEQFTLLRRAIDAIDADRPFDPHA